MRRSFWALLLVGQVVQGQVLAQEEKVDFTRDVGPLFETHCIRCHHPGSLQGDVSLATSESLLNGYVVPGDPQSSHLLELIRGKDNERPLMPKEGKPLTAEQVAVIEKWIVQGAKWPDGIVLRERSKADKSWWSLQPVASVDPPAAPADALEEWKHHPIDRFILAKLREQGLNPNPPADKRTLLRRATFDLTGLPPTPAQVEEFLNDQSPDAYEKLIERLLASPEYGERWGRHWLDVVRFGESRGFERNEIILNAWPFRDYVIASLNNDKPFDQFIREHLAGDVLGAGQPEIEVGSAFLVTGPYDDVGNQDPVQAAQIRADTIDEMIRATSEAFLGLTVGCARCHDHKFDPILQRDYYSLYATFAGVHHGARVVATEEQHRQRQQTLQPLMEHRQRLAEELETIRKTVLARAEQQADEFAKSWTRAAASRRGTEEPFAPVEARFVKLVVEGHEGDPKAGAGYRIDEFEVWSAGPDARNVALASNGANAHGPSRVAGDFADAYSAKLTIDGRFGTCWLAAGPELIIELAQPTTIEKVLFSSDRTGVAGANPEANFVSDYRIFISMDGQAWTPVADSSDRQPINAAHRQSRLLQLATTAEEQTRMAQLHRELAEVDRQIAQVPPLPVWWVGNHHEAPGPFHVFLGGSPQRRGEPVTISSFHALEGVAASYSCEFDISAAQRRVKLADWIVHPSNPLTRRVLANRIWHYHFGSGIVATPSDFGYMGMPPTHPELLDWLANQLLENGWRLKPMHRLVMTSQTYRQSGEFREQAARIDADARLLWRFPPRRLTAEEIRDTMLSVAGCLDTRMGGPGFRLYHYIQDNVATYVPLDEYGPETYRRSVYHHNARASRIDLMTDFDSPDCAFSTPRRAETTTPLQALTMLNHDFTLDMSKIMAKRIEQEVGTDALQQLRRAYMLCFSREPTDGEKDACLPFLATHGLRAFCRVLFNTSEFIYVH